MEAFAQAPAEALSALPQGYAQQMLRQLGEEGFAAYLRALRCAPERALRVNLLKCPDGAPPHAVQGTGAPVPWAKGAYYLEGDARPGLSPLHEAGLYYLQEPSALSAVSALSPQPGERVLDLCAAPGGKSTQIAALMGGRGLLVANEMVPERSQILSRNIERMGVQNAVVTCASPKELACHFEGFFDRVLVDAPCSGEGLFRRQVEARAQWSEGAVRGCALRQADILQSAARMLAPGGTLVYSTCTFNETENEGVIGEFLHTHAEFAAQPFALAGLPMAERGFLHLYPHRVRGEGHFIAKLQKQTPACSDGASVHRAPPAQPRRRTRGEGTHANEPLCALPDSLSEVLSPGVTFPRLHRVGDCLWSLPEGIELQRLGGLRTLRTGLRLAQKKGSRYEPDHALALAISPEDAARCASLTAEQALAYQAGEALALGDALPAGLTLLCFGGVPLGWGKQSDGLMKNRYPKGLRRRGLATRI